MSRRRAPACNNSSAKLSCRTLDAELELHLGPRPKGVGCSTEPVVEAPVCCREVQREPRAAELRPHSNFTASKTSTSWSKEAASLP